jgi:hypothetical protein
MSRKIWLYVVLGALVIALGLNSMASASGPTIDLAVDANADDIPDALAAEVSKVAASQDKAAAIQDMVSRLPYSAKTRALQKEAEQLQRKLMETKDEKAAQEIMAQLRDLSHQMMADPNYAKTINGLTRLFAPKNRNVDRSGKEGAVAIESVNWGSLWRGDVMLVRDEEGKLGKFTTFLYGMWYTHAGNYDGNSLVYESNSDGVRLKPLSKWQVPGQYIALGYDNKRSAAQAQTALDWAKNKYGTDGRTPYNYWYPDKNTDSRLYCSQLTWKIHNYLGVNMDSNHWQYQNWIAARWSWLIVWTVTDPAVAPDEVGLDSDLTIYSATWN